jgi:hypothetical protein
METKVFRTNLKCQSCVSKLAPVMDADPAIGEWSVRTDDDRKLLSVTGKRIDAEHVGSLLNKAGFAVVEEISDLAIKVPAPPIQGSPQAGATYFPLLLVFLYLAGFVALSQFRAGRWNSMAAMNAFMGAFFVVFSFFKLLNIRGFADAYRSYDLVAGRLPAYGYLYPFIELALGVCYLTAFAPVATNLANCAVMSVGAIGVARTLLRKNKIQCACLGTVFNLPMSRITLVEDLLMAGMSASMIAAMVCCAPA